MTHNCVPIAFSILLLLAGAASAAPATEVVTGVVVTADGGNVVLDTAAGRETFALDGEVQPAGLVPGDVVLVRVDAEGAADSVLIIEESVEVTADFDPDAERAVLGTVRSTSTDQLLVETTTGEQAFVVNPEKLFPPLPTPDQRVAVTYRTLEVHPPQHLATGLIILPDDFRLTAGNVQVTTEPTVVAQAPTPPRQPLAERVEQAPPPLPAPAPMIAPVDEPIRSLPQTGTPLPLLLGAGALLFGLGIATRHTQ